MPTVLEAIGTECPTWLDGRALTPFLDGGTPADWREAVHWEYDFREVATGEAEAALGLPIDLSGMSVIRDEDVKYVHFAGFRRCFSIWRPIRAKRAMLPMIPPISPCGCTTRKRCWPGAPVISTGGSPASS